MVDHSAPVWAWAAPPFRGPAGTAKRQHQAALDAPRGFETPILLFCRALASYAEQHAARFDGPIGEDYVLGDYWRSMAQATLGLLNGDTGRLDCGSVDAWIRETATAHGVDLDT